ncbi:MAG: antibiotic biosynthesis monooxygenase [Brasilonema octagenarum HA4186-MV1]|jgi:quinol monooxygenase YgiN|uniref:Antibiotic biosynthesis monooxygenase n=3 Tax=Scytonemataceae TaxID=1182 RepID=A0A856MPF6_9CYAN|nr:antibiotic biosynthesis monooxygenase [Brasilonema octagenarum HA4186-MV1]NMF62650.1 antibiotic biosynthesis monooxygenase [Brasilonema octagenarum UFV-OR1]QDL12064.1 antibiotic biosynthesis monooxygenase [Brasilonema sennae CENA114]QDL18441.1 antibiotic biosynthesis monooxygenase [Brasilonema octagenarum UFV-E1]
MPTIAKNNDVITVIIIFAVEAERQQELIDTIIEFLETTVKHQSGFVSSSIHKSIDGVRVMNYAQWKTLEDYQAFINNSEVQAKAAKLSQFQIHESHIYEVVVSKPDDATLNIAKGGLIHLAEFRVKPENQMRLVELEKEYVGVSLQNPGLLSANFHRSLDGVHNVNYGQWRSLADFEELLKDPKYKPLSEYWQGLAENKFHLYEVVYTQPTD